MAVELVRAPEVKETLSAGYTDERGNRYDRTFVEFDMGRAFIPMDMISDEIWDLVGQEEWSLPAFATFDSWSEAEEFVGLEYGDNPMLEKAIMKDTTITYPYGRGKEATGKCVVQVVGSLKAPSFIELHVNYIVDPEGKYDDPINEEFEKIGVYPYSYDYFQVRVDAFFATEASYQNIGRRSATLNGQDGTYEEYTTANGVEALILCEGESSNLNYAHAMFSLNGAEFWVDCHGFPSPYTDQQETVETLKKVLDSFE